MCRRANCFFQLFSFCDPIVKTFLFQTYCLSLYGACTWKLDCEKLQSLIVAFNNSLRKIWNLPRSTHTGVLHCASGLGSIINKIIKISLCHIVTSCNSSSRFISFIFRDCCTKVYMPIGFNVHCATDFVKQYSQTDLIIGYLVRNLCLIRVNSRNFRTHTMNSFRLYVVISIMCLRLLICSVLPFSFIYIVPNLVCITMIIIIIIIIIINITVTDKICNFSDSFPRVGGTYIPGKHISL